MCAKIWCTNFQPSSCYKKVASLSWKHCTHPKGGPDAGPGSNNEVWMPLALITLKEVSNAQALITLKEVWMPQPRL